MTPPYARPNRFLNSLQERSATSLWGLWCSIPSPVTAELCAGGGFDWLLFDMEHAPADIKDIYGALQAVSAYRSEEHTSELQSLMRISYAVFCLKKQKNTDSETT